ncbi:MAG: hypothetical protein NVSMB18_34000 [Acetobacteraceae bacterium]
MMRRLLPLMVVFALFGFQGPAAQAGQQDFKLVNRTGYQIDEVYVSRTRSREWGDDVMGSNSLENGRTVDITFTAPPSACNWDLMVKYSDGDEATWNSLNLCNIEKVTLYWDKRNEKTRAVTE